MSSKSSRRRWWSISKCEFSSAFFCLSRNLIWWPFSFFLSLSLLFSYHLASSRAVSSFIAFAMNFYTQVYMPVCISVCGCHLFFYSSGNAFTIVKNSMSFNCSLCLFDPRICLMQAGAMKMKKMHKQTLVNMFTEWMRDQGKWKLWNFHLSRTNYLWASLRLWSSFHYSLQRWLGTKLSHGFNESTRMHKNEKKSRRRVCLRFSFFSFFSSTHWFICEYIIKVKGSYSSCFPCHTVYVLVPYQTLYLFNTANMRKDEEEEEKRKEEHCEHSRQLTQVNLLVTWVSRVSGTIIQYTLIHTWRDNVIITHLSFVERVKCDETHTVTVSLGTCHRVHK